MKRIMILTVTLLMIVMSCVTITVFADEKLCADEAYCLTEDESNALNETLEGISKRQKCDVAVHTTSDFDGKTPTEYADDYYDVNGYGYGDDNNGIILVLNLDSREWALSTCGYGITAFTDAGQDYIMNRIMPELSEDDYAGAFNEYAALCDDFLTQARKGEPYDNGNLPGKEKSFNIVLDIAAGLIFGILIAFIAVRKDKAALKTVRREAAARNYLRCGSLQLTVDREEFVYSNIDRIRKEKPSGSSTHTSSSGTSHGGSSGKF